jgi:hypothetical protein
MAMKLMDAQGFGAHVSVMWGVNAIASVLGSVLSIIVALRVGFSWALIMGAVSYALVALLFLRVDAQFHARAHQQTPSSSRRRREPPGNALVVTAK